MHCLKYFLSITLAFLFLLVSIAGCTKAPDEELAAAQAAVKKAEDAEADKYMPNNFQNLQKAMTAAESEIALQNSKIAFSRNYTKAKVLLNNVIDLAKQITTDAPAAKEEMRKQVEAGLASAQKKVKETRVDIKKTPKSMGKKALEQMSADLNEADKIIKQAQSDFDSGNIIEAGKKLSEVQRLLKRISDKLSTGGTDNLM